MYQNPIPTLDDEYVAQDFAISLHYRELMTAKEAAESFSAYVKEHGLPTNWMRIGEARLLATPEQLNKLKDKMLEPRLEGEWLPLANKNNYIHCICSVCGYMDEAIRAVTIGRSSDEYTGAKYKFCPNCGSSMAAGSSERTHIKRTLRIQTPHGPIEAALIPDSEYPGIALTAINEDGDKISCAIMEWDATNQQFKCRVYSYENPDGEPTHIIPMSREYESLTDTAIKKAIFAKVFECGTTITVPCSVNTNNHEVFDLDEISTVGLGECKREYILIDDKEHPVKVIENNKSYLYI